MKTLQVQFQFLSKLFGEVVVSVKRQASKIPSSEATPRDANTGDMTGRAFKGTLAEYNQASGTNYKTHQEVKHAYYGTANPYGYDPQWIKDFDRSMGYVNKMFMVGTASRSRVLAGQYI
ncbi:MAG: hypothetical protein R2836_05545 [Chitinophagales bacterium]